MDYRSTIDLFYDIMPHPLKSTPPTLKHTYQIYSKSTIKYVCFRLTKWESGSVMQATFSTISP